MPALAAEIKRCPRSFLSIQGVLYQEGSGGVSHENRLDGVALAREGEVPTEPSGQCRNAARGDPRPPCVTMLRVPLEPPPNRATPRPKTDSLRENGLHPGNIFTAAWFHGTFSPYLYMGKHFFHAFVCPQGTRLLVRFAMVHAGCDDCAVSPEIVGLVRIAGLAGV